VIGYSYGSFKTFVRIIWRAIFLSKIKYSRLRSKTKIIVYCKLPIIDAMGLLEYSVFTLMATFLNEDKAQPFGYTNLSAQLSFPRLKSYKYCGYISNNIRRVNKTVEMVGSYTVWFVFSWYFYIHINFLAII